MQRLYWLVLSISISGLCLTEGLAWEASSYSVHQSNTDTTEVDESAAMNVPDRIVLTNGQERRVKVMNVTDRFVYYNTPSDESLQYMRSSEVDLIYYADGRTEQVSASRNQPPREKDWSEVVLTEKKSDVEGLIEIGNVEARAIPPSNTVRYRASTLEANAEILMKRRAAQVNADIVLITGREVYIAYGDTPSVTLNGVAYRKR